MTTALDVVQFLDEIARRQGLNLDQLTVEGLQLRAPGEPAPAAPDPYLELRTRSGDLPARYRLGPVVVLDPNCTADCTRAWKAS